MTDLLFSDVEESVIERLRADLGVSVYAQIPKVTNDMLPFVRVERLGGPRVNVAAEQATVTIEAWAQTWKAAHDLAQLARQSIHGLRSQHVAGTTFARVDEFAGPGRLADPVSGKPRFVFTVSLTVHPF